MAAPARPALQQGKKAYVTFTLTSRNSVPDPESAHCVQTAAWRSLNALTTTDTELALIAAAAIIGLRRSPVHGNSTPAAIGTPSTLYTKARNRFWRILRMVARESRRARTMP